MAGDLVAKFKLQFETAQGVRELDKARSSYAELQDNLKRSIGTATGLQQGITEAKAASATWFSAKEKLATLKQQAEQAGTPIKVLNQAISASEKETRAARAAMDAKVASLNRLRTAASAAGIDVRNLAAEQARLAAQKSSVDTAVAKLPPPIPRKNMREGMDSISDQLGRAGTLGAIAVGGMVGGSGMGAVARLADEYGSLNARVKLTAGSLLEFRQATAGVLEISNRHGVSIAETTQFYSRVAGSVKLLGGNQRDALGVTEAMAAALRLGGSTSAEASSAMLQFSQALAAGTLHGQELNAILESAPELARGMAAALGMTVGDLKKAGEEGSLTSKTVMDATLRMKDDLVKRAAQMPLTLGQSLTDLKNAATTYIGVGDQASGTTRNLAKVVSGLAGNFDAAVGSAATLTAGLGTLYLGMKALQAGAAIRSAGGIAAMIGAGTAGIGIPVMLALLAAGGAAWLMFGDKAAGAGDKATAAMRKTIEELKDYDGRMDARERKAKMEVLRKQIEEQEKVLKGPLTGIPVKGLQGEEADPAALKAEKKKIQEAQEKIKKEFADLEAAESKSTLNAPLTKARAALGLDKLSLSGPNLVDKDAKERLDGFSNAAVAFAKRALDDNGKLKISYGELRESVSTLLELKTPAEFNSGIAKLRQALSSYGGDKPEASMNAILQTLIVGRHDAAKKQLDALIAGLMAGEKRTLDLFASVSGQARMASASTQAMAKVAADLAHDQSALSGIDAAGSRGEMSQAQAQTSLKLDLLEQERRARMALTEEIGKQARVTAQEQIAEKNLARDKAVKELDRQIAEKLKTETPSDGILAEIAALEGKKRDLYAATAAAVRDLERAGVQGVKDAEAQKQDIERQSALARKSILEDLQKTAATQAQSALERYKSYAQQVIDLDKQIARNRLDTASAISALQRRDMAPSEQADSLRKEMARVQAEANAAYRSGDKAGALDLLQRKKGLAGELANVKGEGVDPKAQKEEAIAALTSIGAQADAILREQREEAAKAAQEQKAVYIEMTAAVKALAQEIAKLNASEAIKLKTEINTDSLNTAIGQIRAALAKETFQLNVAAGNVGSAIPSGLSPAAMAVASQAPAAAVGAALPAMGAEIAGKPAPATPSLVERAVAPVIRAASDRADGKNNSFSGNGGMAPGIQSLQSVNITWPDGRRSQVWTKPDATADLHRAIQDTASMWGQP
jgi:tape measure domain-containing protein